MRIGALHRYKQVLKQWFSLSFTYEATALFLDITISAVYPLSLSIYLNHSSVIFI